VIGSFNGRGKCVMISESNDGMSDEEGAGRDPTIHLAVDHEHL
jgi:hypothetical protein